MIKRLLIGLLGLVVLGVIGIFVLAWRSALPPIEPPAASSFPDALIAQGEVLAGAGNCASCHTQPGGQAYAGGVGLESGFGTIFSTNITPDADTGIGRWSEQAFARALHEGVARDGSQLFPAFPFDHFTKVRDEDIKALYAFFMTRQPLKAEAKQNALPFPLNVRALQAGWKLLFLHKGVYQPDPDKSEQWNRGAYLVEGLAHCAACHTPRNRLGAERTDAEYAGAMIESWLAPALTAANPAPMPWTQDELFAYLRTGATALHGSAAGAMSDVVHAGLAKVPDADVRAIAVYFADIDGSASRAASADAALAKAMAFEHRDMHDDIAAGANLYVAACASCHYNSGASPLPARPGLALNSALTGPDPSNLIHVILDGIGRDDGMPVLFMPGFAGALSDADIATLAAWLRRTRTDQPEWKDLQATVGRIRSHQG
ncbi:MAG: cytochrome c [Rudaea sp.]|nr:cytochrome c [Rudaea sp.]